MFKRIDYFFLIAAYLSFMGSVALWFLKDQQAGMYVGLWVPSILTRWVGMKQIVYNRKKWFMLFPIFMFGVIMMGIVALGILEAGGFDE